MLNFLALQENQFINQHEDTKDVVWICAEQPTKEEIDYLISTYQLPHDYVTGILDDDENSRFEGLHQNSLEEPALLLLQYPVKSLSPSGYNQLNTYPLALIMTTNNKVISVANHPADFIQKAMNSQYDLSKEHLQEEIVVHLAWFLSLSYNDYLKTLGEKTDSLESELQVTTQNKQLYQVMDFQKSLVYFEAALKANRDVLGALYKARVFENSQQHLPRLHDVIVETRQALTTTQIQMQIVDKISETFSAIVSNNLNNVMKILTSLTIVLTIPTIIGGVFGMNVKLPFANREDAFWWIFILTTILCVLAIRTLKKKNLL
ncbi:hypothetical protein RU97_GL002499 [Enterococcus canis]|uniref:Magnesium transporter CorA family protein n=1 Tax=Enterococcus canis TaxID=214095 RepID=A0A1L8RD50_9ENTE|nr:magnesium transporter CorA family protein [Enterococcus canis]OJG17709.1 hypothetical protein RU97_GL002499 [Enterococcus canis]